MFRALTFLLKVVSSRALMYHESDMDPFAFAMTVSAVAHTSVLTRHPPYKNTQTCQISPIPHPVLRK